MRFIKGIILIVAAISISMMVPQQPNQPQDTNTRLKSLYIYNFCTLVDWPKEFKSGNFVIGVLGESPLYNDLTTRYSSKSVGTQPIQIKQFKETADVSQCHILFIAKEKSDKVGEMAKKWKSKSTLIVTEKEGLLTKGAIINFVIRRDKLSYELSKPNAQNHKLVIGSTLVNLAEK